MRRNDLALRLATRTELAAERVLPATGFASNRPGGEMVDALIASAALPRARCGYPIVTPRYAGFHVFTSQALSPSLSWGQLPATLPERDEPAIGWSGPQGLVILRMDEGPVVIERMAPASIDSSRAAGWTVMNLIKQDKPAPADHTSQRHDHACREPSRYRAEPGFHY